MGESQQRRARKVAVVDELASSGREEKKVGVDEAGSNSINAGVKEQSVAISCSRQKVKGGVDFLN